MTPRLIGSSETFRPVIDVISMIAQVDSPVLLLGETGTGKDVLARTIHETSPRRGKPFVPVNCAAIPGGLLESELFGFERGAFTGAASQTPGRFQTADHGTLFLDEIGDLPLDLQPKLLRALEERRIERLGSSGRQVSVDVRIIAATNQNLWEMVQRRLFRADLYFRLSVFPIAIPPLRQRTEDIPALVTHFVRHFGERYRKSIGEIPDEVFDVLRRQPWPGNVRELQNVVERAVILSQGPCLQLAASDPRPLHPGRSRTLAEVVRDHILGTLRETNWVVGGWDGAAARLGLSRTTLIAKMQKLGLSKASGPSCPARLRDHNERPGGTSAAEVATATSSPRTPARGQGVQ